MRATDFIESLYASRFIGARGSDAQGLHWPADGAYLPTSDDAIVGVPDTLKRACAEYALRALSAPLAPDSDGGAVASESESGGRVSYSVTYATPGGLPRYPAADRLLGSLLCPPTAMRY